MRVTAPDGSHIDKHPWMARHSIKAGKQTIPVVIPSVECDECPVSFITPQSEELVAIVTRAQLVGKAAGASLFGPDLSKWPARMYDAATLVAAEDAKVESEVHKAINGKQNS